MARPAGQAYALILSFVVLALLASTTWVAAAGGEGRPEVVKAVQPAVEVYDFLQINIADPGGDTVAFGDGQQICLSVAIDPPLTPGGTPWITHCYGTLPGQTLHANRPTTPFLRSSAYSIAVASNNTGCDVSLPAMSPADYGPGSGWYAIFNVTADCPAAPPPSPTATTPPPPTATIAPSPTATPPDEYSLLGLWFTPVGSTPPVLTGPVCVLIVSDPPFVGTSLYEFCTTNSSTNTGFGTDPGETFPTSSTYTATIVSNDSGCLVTAGPLREATGDSGFLGIFDITIDCDSDPAPTEIPSPTATATSPSSPTPTATTPSSPTPTATMGSTSTVMPSPTATSPATTSGSVPPTDEPPPTETMPATSGVTPTSTETVITPSEASTVPGSTATGTSAMVVTNLPTTGAGPLDRIPRVLLLSLGGLLLLLGAKAMQRSQAGR